MTLFKNMLLTKYKKRKNSLDWLKETKWETNGTHLVMFTQGNKIKIFDLETGIKIHKQRFDYNNSYYAFTYDHDKGMFYYIYKDDFLRYRMFKFEKCL